MRVSIDTKYPLCYEIPLHYITLRLIDWAKIIENICLEEVMDFKRIVTVIKISADYKILITKKIDNDI